MKVVVKTNPLKRSVQRSMSYSKVLPTVVFLLVAVVFIGTAAAMFIGYAYSQHIGMLICAICLTVFGVAFPPLVFFVFLPYVRRKQVEMTDLSGMYVLYEFSDDSVKRSYIGASEQIEDKYTAYVFLEKVTETPTDFFLFTADKAEARIPKADIIEGTAEQLAQTLKNAIGAKKYYKV